MDHYYKYYVSFWSFLWYTTIRIAKFEIAVKDKNSRTWSKFACLVFLRNQSKLVVKQYATVGQAWGSKTHKSAGSPKIPYLWFMLCGFSTLESISAVERLLSLRVTTSTHQRVSADWTLLAAGCAKATELCNPQTRSKRRRRRYDCECRRSPPLGAQPVCFVNSLALFVREHSLSRSGQFLFDKIDWRKN